MPGVGVFVSAAGPPIGGSSAPTISVEAISATTLRFTLSSASSAVGGTMTVYDSGVPIATDADIGSVMNDNTSAIDLVFPSIFVSGHTLTVTFATGFFVTFPGAVDIAGQTLTPITNNV